jgi:signal transduction histidine kinase
MAVGLSCAVAGWAMVIVLYRLLGTPFPFLFFPSVFVATLLAERTGGTTGIVASLVGVYYYTPPVGWGLALSGAISIALYFVGSFAIVEVIVRMQEAIATRDALLSVVSHDLKSPLSNISLREHRLLTRLKQGQRPLEPADIQRHGEAVVNLVSRLSLMIGNLLDLGRIQEGRGSGAMLGCRSWNWNRH